ncbi:MAG: hypothetical protein RIR00_2312 [Pseudomonadota bacterium]
MDEPVNLMDVLSCYEGADVEYKSARGGLPASLWETYCAFANSGGGTIWLGVVQRGEGLEIQGVMAPEKLLSDFWNTVNNRSKVSLNLLRNEDVAIVCAHVTEPAVLRIHVPRADRRQRPVFLRNDPLGSTFRRNHEGDYRCTEAEVRRMFADQSEEPADSRILPGFSTEDLHPDSLRHFRLLAESTRLGETWRQEDDIGLLRKLGGWRRDRTTNAEGLTLAGLLMFGRNEAIRDPAAVPGFHLDYRERFSDDPAIRWTDRLTPDGTWEGNLFQFYRLVSLKLASGPGIKRPFQTDATGRRVAVTRIDEALQESLVNALIHADYTGQGGVVIDRYPDRLIFSNPGTLLVSREQLMAGGISECRNKSLQLMFQVLGAGDKAGSGIDRIRASWAAEHWQSPELREVFRPDRVLLELPMVSLLPETVLTDLHARFGRVFGELSGDELQAVAVALETGKVTNQHLQGMLTMHRVDITNMLGSLVRRGFLVSDGIGRGTRYFVATDQSAENQGASPVSDGASPVSDGASPVSDGASLVSDGASPVSDGASPVTSGYISEGERVSDLPPELHHLARSIREQRRTHPEQMRQVIQRLCSWDYLTAQQMATWLGRSKKRLQDEFLRPMCAAGVLTMRYPKTPNHMQQAYRAIPANEEGGLA